MKKITEKILLILLFISIIVNFRQCSFGDSHYDEIEMLEHEIKELESIISKTKEKKVIAPEVKKKIENKEVKKLKPKFRAPEPVDSIKTFDSVPSIQIIDSNAVN